MKNKIILIVTASIIVLSLLTIILYNEIPRLSFTFDKELNGYVIKKAYGSVDTYDIPRTYKDYDVVGIGEQAFSASKVSYLDLSETNIKEIRQGAFADCSNLSEIIFNENLSKIANNAFMNCPSLNRIDLRNTNLEILGGSVFFDCINLTEVYLPKSLEELGSYCFYNTSLTKLSYYSNLNLRENALLIKEDKVLADKYIEIIEESTIIKSS